MVSVPNVTADASLCAAFVRELAVSGSSISVSGPRGLQLTVCASGPLAARLDALQFELGEGPRWEAIATRRAILCPDLDLVTRSPWPFFLDAARQRGTLAVFAFPMMMGAALVGVVDLSCTSPRAADGDFTSRASRMADQVSNAAVQIALRSAQDPDSAETRLAPALRREVHQATGMIISQLSVSATDAFARLQGHAFATGTPIDEVARCVVRRELLLGDLPDDSRTG